MIIARDSTTIALQRFGFGPSPEERARLASDPRGARRAELEAPVRLPPELAALPSTRDALALIPRALRAARRGTAASSVEMKPASVEASAADETAEPARQRLREHVLAEVSARFAAAANTATPLRERLVHFWANHFTVSGTKPQVLPLIGAFEREAIRPNLDGRFEDLLIATTFHPAMLIYLDNDRSIGPDSPAGRRHDKGLNENLAREILELRTLGVGGGYTQADVTSFARVLTGHGLDLQGTGFDGPGYRFQPARHQPGVQTVLGRRYAEAGAEQARAVLRDLARHPSTARHLATQLARYFIGDPVSPRLVQTLEQAYRDTDGELKAVHAALLGAPEAWDAPLARMRTPEEWLIATRRLLGERTPMPPPFVAAALQQLGQPPFRAPSPAGWPLESSAWLGGDALLKRMEFALAVASRQSDRDALPRAEATLGDLIGADTRAVVAGAESPAQALALLLVSPEFNRC